MEGRHDTIVVRYYVIAAVAIIYFVIKLFPRSRRYRYMFYDGIAAREYYLSIFDKDKNKQYNYL